MSRNARRDHEPDKQKFLELLSSAIGSRTQLKFASDCDLSQAYVSRLLRSIPDNLPSIPTLRKIGAHAENGVTLSDLLFAAGYDPDKYPRNVGDEYSLTQYEKLLRASVISCLMKTDLRWTATPVKADSYFDLSILLDDCIYKTWNFDFLITSDASLSDNWHRRIIKCYEYIMTANSTPETMTSIVTNSETIFQYLCERDFSGLTRPVSALLFDIDNLTLSKEFLFSTAVSNNSSDENKTTLRLETE